MIPVIPLVASVALVVVTAAVVMAGLLGGLLGVIGLVLTRQECRGRRSAQGISVLSIVLGFGFAAWMLADQPGATRFILDVSAHLG
jgi:uncharacterized membrane protein